jgi:hypothetical protein
MPELTKCCRDCMKGPLFDPLHYANNINCRRRIKVNFWRQREESRSSGTLYTWTPSKIWSCPGYRPGPDDRYLRKENIQLLITRLRIGVSGRGSPRLNLRQSAEPTSRMEAIHVERTLVPDGLKDTPITVNDN